METLSCRAVRRLALASAGLFKPEWSGFPKAASGNGVRARKGAHAVIERFGYLQLDTISIAGARSHGLVLLSRLAGFEPRLAEDLLQPGEPLFEYWGHEASWMPIELYPAFDFRRRAFLTEKHYGKLLNEQPKMAREIVARVRGEGPLRSVDLEGGGSGGFWDYKVSKFVAVGLWLVGKLAIRQRSGFQRTFDLPERVIPQPYLGEALSFHDSLRLLLGLALDGHGWASEGTLAATWRLANCRAEVRAALAEMEEAGEVVRAEAVLAGSGQGERPAAGWIKPRDLELAARLERARPRRDRGVLLSPFDPVLWDRKRVAQLFGFDQILEIYKPVAQRLYGYYCLPVLAGDRLVARYDLRAETKAGRLKVLSLRFEGEEADRAPGGDEAEATRTALGRYAAAIGLLPHPPG